MTEPVDELTARLREAPDELAGADWLDVRRRARRSRRRTVAIIVAAAFGVVAVPTIAVGGQVLEVLGIRESDEPVPAAGALVPPYVHGDRLYGYAREPVRLARRLLAPLLGTDEALAMPTGDGRVVYHAFDPADGGLERGGTPVLRVVDPRTRRDRLLARGAQSVAVRRDGAVAYLQATRPTYLSTPSGTLGGRFGRVVVRASLDAPPVVWTGIGEYVVVAWAREALVVEVRPGAGMLLPAGKAGPDTGVYVLDGPRRARRLPLTEVVALSPDGQRVLGTFRQGDGPVTATRLVDAASGRVVASAPIQLGSGAWTGERIVAPLGMQQRRLAVVRVTGKRLLVERTLRLAHNRSLAARYGPFLSRPVFAPGGRRVVIRVVALHGDESARFTGFLTCEIEKGVCVRGRDLRPPRIWAAVLDNPSRP